MSGTEGMPPAEPRSTQPAARAEVPEQPVPPVTQSGSADSSVSPAARDEAPAQPMPPTSYAETPDSSVPLVPPVRRAGARDQPVPPTAHAETSDPSVPPAPQPPVDSQTDPRPAPHTEAPSEDVATAETSALPGEHRGGFHREFTEPVPITESVHIEPEVLWAAAPERLPRSAGWALVFAILGLILSFLVGWGFLVGLVGAGLAIVALRRPWESRQTAVWALCLSLLSLVYSAGWLWWASTQGPLFG